MNDNYIKALGIENTAWYNKTPSSDININIKELEFSPAVGENFTLILSPFEFSENKVISIISNVEISSIKSRNNLIPVEPENEFWAVWCPPTLKENFCGYLMDDIDWEFPLYNRINAKKNLIEQLFFLKTKLISITYINDVYVAEVKIVKCVNIFDYIDSSAFSSKIINPKNSFNITTAQHQSYKNLKTTYDIDMEYFAWYLSAKVNNEESVIMSNNEDFHSELEIIYLSKLIAHFK